jgi:hypothetical protein
VTHVQAITKVWVDGKLTASSCRDSDHIPSMLTADVISTTTLQAARAAIHTIEAKYPATEPEQGKD